MQKSHIKLFNRLNLLLFVALLTLVFSENIRADAASSFTLKSQAGERYISQNNAVSDTVKIETIYVSQEGANLGWVVRVNDTVIAIDASGSLLKILSKGTDSQGISTVEYYTNLKLLLV